MLGLWLVLWRIEWAELILDSIELTIVRLVSHTLCLGGINNFQINGANA